MDAYLQRHARVPLGVLPTPVQTLERFSAALGEVQISIKRDDLTGLAFGGNKVRKLEYILADALAANADTIITAGAVQSNHCRQTAAAAAKLNLECHLLLGGSVPPSVDGNLLLDQLLGSHIHWAGEQRKGESLAILQQQLQAQGRKPYVVPYGGSNELGVVAFVQAMHELYIQSKQTFPYTHIVFASSSGATHSGLMLGASLLNIKCELLGIAIDKEESGEASLVETIVSLSNRTAEQFGLATQFESANVHLDYDYSAAGYAVVTAAEKEAIRLLATSEGILLDPVYTGRAMAGLIDYVRKKRFTADDHVLFWHSGGQPALFAYADELQSCESCE